MICIRSRRIYDGTRNKEVPDKIYGKIRKLISRIGTERNGSW